MLVFFVLLSIAGFLLYKSIRLPGVALVGLFCMFAVEQWAQSQSSFFLERNTLINVLFALIVAFAMAVRLYRDDFRIDHYPLAATLVIILFGYAMLSTLWTYDVVNTKAIWTKWAPYVVVQVVIAPLLVVDPKDFTKIFKYQIFLGGLFAALILFGSEYQGRKIVLGDDNSISGNPLAVAEMAGITVFCTVLMKRMFRFDIIIKLIIASICIVAIVKSGSRGQLIALAFALFVAFPFVYSIENPKVLVGSVLVALILGVVVVVGLDAYWADSGRFSGEGMSSDYLKRMGKIERLMTAWIDSPAAIIFGLGNSASFNPAINFSYPHNVPVEILGEEGLVGAILYVWMMMIVVRDGFYVLRRRISDRSDNAGFAIMVAIIVYLFFISLKQGNLIGSTTFFMSVILFTRTVAYTRAQDRLRRLESAKQNPEIAGGRQAVYARQAHLRRRQA